jgi:uncharacterized iron-regulated protein
MKLNKHFCAALALAVAPTALSAIPAYAAPDAAAVVKYYTEVGHAKYEDALTTAKTLDVAIDAFLKAPTDETLAAARAAWIKARVPYQQTEVYRFGNPIVDDWEGKVNAWPLDEGLIDYVDTSYGTESDENALYVANVIANKTIKIDGKDVDASKLTPEFLSGTLAGSRRHRSQRCDRLPRHRIPALGPGPERHRPGCRQPPGHRLRPQELHARQLRPPRRISEVCLDAARVRPAGNG